jgi:hypothetical protein
MPSPTCQAEYRRAALMFGEHMHTGFVVWMRAGCAAN